MQIHDQFLLQEQGQGDLIQKMEICIEALCLMLLSAQVCGFEALRASGVTPFHGYLCPLCLRP